MREGCHEPQPCQKSLLRQPITPRSDARLRVFADLNPVRSVKTAISEDVTQNKVIGTRGQGVRVWSPRELTTEHLTKPSLRLD